MGAYGCFDGAPSGEELERFFFLDDEDRRLIAKRRGEANRLGFALQLTTVRFLGAFLDDPLEVPSAVLDELAVQLGIADPSCVKTYVERVNTKWEHRREICRVDGWREFASVREELTRWIDHRAWTTGSGPKAVFDGVIAWLRRRQVLLPAVRELERLVSRVVRAAHLRLWSTLAESLSAQQAELLLDLVEVPGDRRFSALEVLRRGPVDRTGKALCAALNRVAQVAGIGLGGVDLGVVPQRRVVDLARRGMTSNATDLRRTMPYSKKLATLLATVGYLEAKATDDALELFEVIMTSELLARAERQSSAEKLKRYPRLCKDARRLAAAVSVLLEAQEWDEDIAVGVLWDAIDNVVSRAELRVSVASIHQILRHWPDIVRVVASVHSGEIAASDAMRMLQRGGNPTQLGDALAHFGRIFKTLHVLAYVDREPYRRDIKRMRNLQEERHGLAKHVFHGRKGELRAAYHAGMEDQLGALGLVINCITLWNTLRS
ncbi:MAG: DUF4158 domain-containing protein [Pseudonocardiaceae bacterium]